jgi:hypothetical protein
MDLVTRVKGILLSPASEWTTIEAESATIASIYTGYVIPLALIPAIAGFIGNSIIGYGVFGSHIRVPVSTGLGWACVQFVGTLAGVFVVGLIIDALAPSFGGQKSPVQALKVAAYSDTAVCVAGISALIPGFRWLGILGLYSLYLFWLGLPKLMKSPADKSLGYTVVVIVCAIVVFAVVGAVAGYLTGFGRMY